MANVKIDFANINTPEGLKDLDNFLSYHSFVGGVKEATTDDVAVFKKLPEDLTQYGLKNILRWYSHVATWIADPPANLKAGSFPLEAAKATAEDDIDLFGDDDDGEEAEALKKKQEALKTAKKKKEAAKSSLVIHIEPASVNTDLDKLLALVKEIKLEGVTWGEASAKIPLAFGIQKLQVSCTILDELVNTNEIVELIEELGMTEEMKEVRKQREENEEEEEDSDDENKGLVQSATIVSFNKL